MIRRAPAPADRELREKLERLAEVVRGKRRPLVLTHDNPDPDSLASAVGLAFLLRRRFGLAARVAYGGIVGRAENQAMVRVLQLPIVPVSRLVFDEYDLLCLVDTQPEAGNHSLPVRHRPDIVLDHHPLREGSRRAPFADVGGEFGATSTMLVRYLRGSGVEPDAQVATALFYGLKSDTRDLGRETCRADEDAYLWLFPRVDKLELGRIEHPDLPPAYFQLLHAAIERARRYGGPNGDLVVSDLGALYAPDLTAEIAERFLHIEGVRWSLALGSFHGDIFVSLRTNDPRDHVGQLIREICAGLGGTSGGHWSMAGARLPLPHERRRRLGARREILGRFLAALGGHRGQRGKQLLDQGPGRTTILGAVRRGPRRPYR